MSILGTRPEIIRLSRVLAALDEAFNHVFVYTNQNYDYELSGIFFEQLRVRKPDHILEVKSDTLGGQVGNIISQTETVMKKENPDAVLILGDTNSALSAIMARRLKIPIFHMEAGNRCFDWNVPEEINRRIVDHISNYNICYTEHARRYLMQEGIAAASVFVFGSPLREVTAFYAKDIEAAEILAELNLEPGKYFLVSAHREENVDSPDSLKIHVATLNSVATTYNLPVVVSLHPRTQKRLELVDVKLNKQIMFHKPFGFFEYNKLQKNALCVISDSGTIQEESAIMRFNAIQIRNSTERPEAYDAGSIIVCGMREQGVLESLALTLSKKNQSENTGIPADYQDANVSLKVVKLLTGKIATDLSV